LEIIDILILITILIPALVGVIYGFLNIILSIVAWVIAFGITVKFSSYFAPLLSSYVETELLRNALAFVGLFMLSLMILSGAGYFMVKLLGRTGLTGADRMLGLVFGSALGGSIVAVIIFLAGFTDLSREDWWQQSLLVKPFERTAVWGRQFIPENIAKYHQYGGGNTVEN
jgi:membrane protein required for colicin V production